MTLATLYLVSILGQGNTPAATFDASQFVRQTDALIRSPRTEELISLAAELEARGMDAAAKAVTRQIATTADDYDRLVRKSLQVGQLVAADAILGAWARRFPQDPRVGWLRAVYYQNQGETELALRANLALARDLPANLKAVAGLQRSLLAMEQRRQPAGVDANPWDVDFVGDDGKYTAGKLAASQSSKLPEGAAANLAALVALVPRQGNLWALLGELFNASGDSSAALAAFQRAEALQYTPRKLLEHRRVIEAYQREQARQAEAKLTGSLDQDAAPQLQQVSPAQVRLVLALGGACVAVIIALQIREWLKRK